MAKKDKFTAEGAEVQAPVEMTPEEQAAIEARNAELGALADEETSIKQRLGEIANRRRELGVTRVVNRGPRGVGEYVKTQIKEGKTNDEILSLVKENFPENNTNANCVNWYRNAPKIS